MRKQEHPAAPAAGDLAYYVEHRGDTLRTRGECKHAQVGKAEPFDMLFFIMRGEIGKQLTAERRLRNVAPRDRHGRTIGFDEEE